MGDCLDDFLWHNRRVEVLTETNFVYLHYSQFLQLMTSVNGRPLAGNV